MNEITGASAKNRARGTYICGNPGYGKSSLIQRQILRDIKKGKGVCVIDPTEQLIKIILGYIPKEHLDRVVYFNTSMGVPLKFFNCRDAAERREFSLDLANIIDLSTAPVASKYLRRIIKAFFEANANGIAPPLTLWDIPRFVQDQKFIDYVLSKCDPKRCFNFPPHYKPQSESINTLLIRMSELTDSDVLETVLANPDATLDVADLIDQNKIFLVDLEENNPDDAIVGSIIASQIQQAIWKRRHLADLYACEPYCLYIDECDVILQFAEKRFKAILGRARKYKLYMTISNPAPSDLPKDIITGLGKIGNLVLFNLDGKDSAEFKDKIAPYKAADLVNLPDYYALVRTNNTLQFVKTPKFLPPRQNGNAAYVRERTLRDYARKSDPWPHNQGSGKPEPEGTVPSNEAQEAGSRPARPVFRPAEQRPRTASPKSRSNPNRHPNDEPDP